ELTGGTAEPTDSTGIKEQFFGLLSGAGGDGLTTKALPRIYEVLSMVPSSHTTDNPLLKKIDRERVIMQASAYADLGKERGLITLKLGRTGGMISLGEDLVTSTFEGFGKIKTGKGDKIVNHFNQTTLHEIGHAADDNASF